MSDGVFDASNPIDSGDHVVEPPNCSCQKPACIADMAGSGYSVSAMALMFLAIAVICWLLVLNPDYFLWKIMTGFVGVLFLVIGIALIMIGQNKTLKFIQSHK